MNDRHFSNFNLAGFTFYDGAEVLQELKPGALLQMVAEPQNHFDPYAVKLYYGDTHLGYLPRTENKVISKFLQMGHDDLFEVRINRVTPEATPENQVGVTVKIRKKIEASDKDNTNDLGT